MERVKQYYCWVKAVVAQPAVAGTSIGDPVDFEAEVLAATRTGAVPMNVGTAGVGVPPPPKPSDLPPGVQPQGGAGLASLQATTDAGAAADPPQPTAAPPSPAAVDIGVPPPLRRSSVFAGATMMGTWKFEMWRLPGVGEPVLGWQPVLGSRDDAIAWIRSPEGQAWAEHAVTVELVCFTAVGEF